MHVFPFSETKEWHLSLSQKRPLAIPPPLCKIWTPTNSLSTFSRSWHLLLSPLGKYGAAKNNFPLICLVIMDPSYSPIPLPAAQHKDCHSALTRQIAAATGCCHQVAFATSCSSNSIFPHKETLRCNPFENYQHFNTFALSLVIVILCKQANLLWKKAVSYNELIMKSFSVYLWHASFSVWLTASHVSHNKRRHPLSLRKKALALAPSSVQFCKQYTWLGT